MSFLLIAITFQYSLLPDKTYSKKTFITKSRHVLFGSVKFEK